jgi:DNA-binding CsgD family transcriptional regulator/PAS domain-containing protein
MKTSDVSEALVASLIDDTYDAAIDPERWPTLLRRLLTACDAHSAMFVGLSYRSHERGFLIAEGVDQALTPVFLQRHQHNLWSKIAEDQPAGHPVHPQRMARLPGLRRTDFYGEILEPQRIVSSAVVRLDFRGQFDNGGVGVYFTTSHETGEDRAVTLLAALAPHLQRATHANLRLRDAGNLHAGLDDAFDRLPNALLVVDARSRILFANARARALLAADDGLSSLRGELSSFRPEDTRRLRALVGAAVGGGIALERRSAGAALSALIVPLRGKTTCMLQAGCAAQPRALVVVTDPDDAVTPAHAVVDRLRALYGLTVAEARIAVRVAGGRNLQEVAAAMSIGPGTAHTHLKRVFEKTGVHRQSSLARLLSRNGALDLAAPD